MRLIILRGVPMSLHSIGREGELRLTFARHGEHTTLTESFSRPPLQVMRAIRDAAGCLCVYLLSPTGGVVQNDRYLINIDVGENAHALFTTQSATKVYRMPEGCAEQLIRIEVGTNAVFEFVPDAVILFAESDFRQHIEVTLHDGALALLYEIVMPGRTARGEHLQFRRYANRIVVKDDAGLILYDAADIEPSRDDLTTIGRLEGYTCWGSVYLVGDLQRWNIDALEFCKAHRGILERDGSVGSLSNLYRAGVGVRVLSQRLETIYAAFHELRGVIRTQYMKLPNTPLRK